MARALFLPGMLLLMAACRAQQPWPLWQSYTAHFIDGQGRVIDRSAGDRTTSEGQAYGLFFALVADDRAQFDRLLGWTEANLAGGDLTLHLPAWDWGRTASGEWKVRDAHSASDADLWLAYTLIEAGRLWHEPRFDTLGRTVAREIAREEVVLVPGVGTAVAPGPAGFYDGGVFAGPGTRQQGPAAGAPAAGAWVGPASGLASAPGAGRWILNPSYTPPPVIARLAQVLPEGPWAAVAESLPALTGGPASQDFAMDWVAASGGEVRPSLPPHEATAGVREKQPAGSYDAIRVYLWLGMSAPGTAGLKDLESRVTGMAALMQTAPTPPLEVGGDGRVVEPDAPPGFSAAVIPYLLRIGMTREAKAQADRLLATRDTANGLYGRQAGYYDQNLALFSTGFTEQRFRFEKNGRLHVHWE